MHTQFLHMRHRRLTSCISGICQAPKGFQTLRVLLYWIFFTDRSEIVHCFVLWNGVIPIFISNGPFLAGPKWFENFIRDEQVCRKFVDCALEGLQNYEKSTTDRQQELPLVQPGMLLALMKKAVDVLFVVYLYL